MKVACLLPRIALIVGLLQGVAIATFDTDWHIQPQPEFPRVKEDGDLVSLVFGYDIPSLGEEKTIQVSLFEIDCVVPATQGMAYAYTVEEDGLTVDVHLEPESITGSPFWTYQDDVTGQIDFCLRVDLDYDMESMNFHETVRQIMLSPLQSNTARAAKVTSNPRH